MVKKEVLIEPMTRLEGHLGIHAVADLEKGIYVDAHSFVVMFRGFEIILKGREPADAIWITQRICGVCPTPHAIASVQAVDMAYQAPPPPMGVLLRNFLHGAEQLYDAALGCLVLEGPDYSEAAVKKWNPDWWEKARKAKAPNAKLHGYKTIADIMRALNPLSGELWLRSLAVEKLGRKMASLLGGKHPHVVSIVPGGVAKTLTPTDLEQYAAMLAHHVAFAKEFIPVMDDLLDFVLSLGYEECGSRKVNLLSYGAYDDPEAYTARYEDMPSWGLKRAVSPGVVIDGELITQDLIEINVGVREFIDRSYYEDWAGPSVAEDPAGNPLDAKHPWNKETKPKPGPYKAWDSKYSWAGSPRWEDWKKRVDGFAHALEAGPIARMWVTAKAGNVPESTGSSLKFTLPKAAVAGYKVVDEMEFEWKIPERVNTVERVRARAYYYAYTAYVMYNQLLQALEMVKAGKAEVWRKYKKPKDGMGVGMTEAMRGALAHWVVMRGQRIQNYQVITPSGWNAGPRLSDVDLGPYEDAIVGTPITEPTEGELSGIDVVRTIRSFDPCLACCVHLYQGDRCIREIPIC
ncbi:nickel-dependent hydrogenase large subunit [Candidatus Bathyarchaeota archaeon]|nr:nickel-dependent hydrogenase large subunit [Candidatus Bathyarchaeota archaeon]